MASGGKSDVTVYGTTEGVRADAQIGKRLDSRDDRRDADPRPQGDDAAAAQLGVPAGQGHGRSVRQRDLLRDRRRQPPHRPHTCSTARTTTRAGAGRRCSPPCRSARCRRSTVLSNAFSAEYGWTSGPALNIVTKSGTNTLHGEGLYMGRPGGWQAKIVLDEELLPAVGLHLRHAGDARRRSRPVDIPDKLNQVSGSIGGPIVQGQDVLLRRGGLHAAGPHDVRCPPPCRLSCSPTAASSTPASTARRWSNARLDHKLSGESDADVPRATIDHFYDDEPAGRRRRHERAERRPAGTRAAAGPSRSTTRRC